LEDVLTKNTVSARILMPKADVYSEEDFERLQKINGLDIRRFNYKILIYGIKLWLLIEQNHWL
jgi:hypothetical protein